MKPISNTKECHPIQWSAPLQEEGNISYHSICPRKTSSRKKERRSAQIWLRNIHSTKSFINFLEISCAFYVFFVFNSVLFTDCTTT